MVKTSWVVTLRLCFISTFTTPEKHFCLMMNTTFLCFCLYIYFYICTWLDFGNRLFKRKEKKSWFLLLLLFFYAVISSVTKLDLLVRFVNNQSLCVCFVEIQFLRLSTSHSECHVMISHGVIFLCTVRRLQDELVTISLLGRCQLLKYM